MPAWLKAIIDAIVDAVTWLQTYNGALTAVATVIIGWFTWVISNVNKGQLRHARQTERAYFTGGGDCETDSTGARVFRFEVGNHGKTPAFMYEYAVHFATLDQVSREHRPYERRTHVDQFPPGERHRPTGPKIPIPIGAEVIYGAVWYKDIWHDEHYSRFILGIGRDGHSHSNVPGIDSAYYRAWT